MTTLGTFHVWMARVCDADAESGQYSDVQSEHLSKLAGKAARRAHALGANWRDAIEELGAECAMETRVSIGKVSSSG